MIALVDYDGLLYKSIYMIVSRKNIRAMYESRKRLELTEDAAIRLKKDRYKHRWSKVKITHSKLEQMAYIEQEIIDLGINRLCNMYDGLLADIERSPFMRDNGLDITHNEYFITTCENSARKAKHPSYKAARNKTHNPIRKWVTKMRNYVVVNIFVFENEFSFYDSRIEADDLIAIRAEQLGMDNCIIVSPDKDLNTIPGLHFDYNRKPSKEVDEYGNRIQNPMRGMYEISIQEAEYNFYIQMLTGDKADDIEGLAGIGPVKAAKILDGSTDLKKSTIDAYKNIHGKEWEKHFNKMDYLLSLGEKVL
jgi:hypothetical protein